MTPVQRVLAAYGRDAEDAAFGYVVAKIRRVAGLTGREFAALLPMESTRLNRIEIGRQRATTADILVIEAALLKMGAIPRDGHLVGLTRRAIPLLDELLLAKARERRAA
jgi:hypothetical protein